MEHLAHEGASDLSLRGLAAAIGTSHRMLIHHFGSKDGLLVAVVQAVEARQRAHLAELVMPADATPTQAMAAFWRHLADPALAPYERLFFELYGQALQGRPGTVALLDDVVDGWLAPGIALGIAAGQTEAEARAGARLGLAITRGLLLDLLATGDRAGVDAALEQFIALLGR